MRINFISYLNPFAHNGGGEQITKKLILSGRLRGHTINQTHNNPHSVDYDSTADLNILWDIFNCPEQQNPFNLNDLQYYMTNKKYVYGTGGYEDICHLGTVPCEGITDGVSCLVSESHETFGPGGIGRPKPSYCSVKRRDILLKNADLCIFFSEAHKNLTKKLIGDVNHFIAIPPCEDLSVFYNQHRERDIEILSYGGHLEYKGFFNIMKKFPTSCPVFLGGGSDTLIRLYNYGKYIGKIPYDQMPAILNRTKKFVHMPRWVEPFGLTTLQALLCGCDVVENENSTVTKGIIVEEYVKEIKRWSNCEPIWSKIESLK